MILWFLVAIDTIFFKLSGDEGVHTFLEELEFRPDRTMDYGVSCYGASKDFPLIYNEKMVSSLFSKSVFNLILFLLAGISG